MITIEGRATATEDNPGPEAGNLEEEEGALFEVTDTEGDSWNT